MTRIARPLPPETATALLELRPESMRISSPERDRFQAFIVKLIDAGWPRAQIGDVLGIAYQSVSGWYRNAASKPIPDDLPHVPKAPRTKTLAKIKPGDGDPRHGTANGYGNLHCRCDACRTAHNKVHAEWVARARQRVDDIPHGTTSGYHTWGCRCDDCSRAVNYKPEKKREREARIAQVRDLIREGRYVDEIMARTGATYASVNSQFRSLGVEIPKRPEMQPTEELLALASCPISERDRLIKITREQGFTLERIGVQAGLTRERVRQIAYDVATHQGYRESHRTRLERERDRYRLAWLSARRRAKHRPVLKIAEVPAFSRHHFEVRERVSA